jgi:hypothetical protein
MTNEEILKKAIDKAKSNGYKTDWILPKGDSIYSVIFSHDFARSFWKGEKCTCIPDKDKEGNIYHKRNCKITTPDWRCHLQNMVLEEDPIKYLEKFL